MPTWFLRAKGVLILCYSQAEVTSWINYIWAVHGVIPSIEKGVI